MNDIVILSATRTPVGASQSALASGPAISIGGGEGLAVCVEWVGAFP